MTLWLVQIFIHFFISPRLLNRGVWIYRLYVIPAIHFGVSEHILVCSGRNAGKDWRKPARFVILGWLIKQLSGCCLLNGWNVSVPQWMKHTEVYRENVTGEETLIQGSIPWSSETLSPPGAVSFSFLLKYACGMCKNHSTRNAIYRAILPSSHLISLVTNQHFLCHSVVISMNPFGCRINVLHQPELIGHSHF